MKKLLVFFLIFSFPLTTFGVIAHVQTNATSGNCTGTSCGVVVGPSNVTAGNFLAVCWRYASGGQTPTLTGNSNTYTSNAVQAIDTADGNSTNGIGYAMNVNGGATTVTVSVASSVGLRITASEFSGVATASAQDKTATAIGSGTLSMNTGNVTPTADGELFFACTHTSSSVVITGGTDFTITTAAAGRIAGAYYVQPTATAHAFNMTSDNTAISWGTTGVTFKAPSAAVAKPLPRVYVGNGAVNISGGSVIIP